MSVQKKTQTSVNKGVWKWTKIASIVTYGLIFIMSLILLLNNTVLSFSDDTKSLVLVVSILFLLPVIPSIIWIIRAPKDIVSIFVLVASLLGVVIAIFGLVGAEGNWNTGNIGLLFSVIYGLVGGLLPLILSCALVLPSLIGLIKK